MQHGLYPIRSGQRQQAPRQGGNPPPPPAAARNRAADEQTENAEQKGLPIAKLQGDASHEGLDQEDKDRAHKRSHNRRCNGITYGLPASALLCQGVAIQTGRRCCGCAGDVDQAGGNAARTARGHKNAHEQCHTVGVLQVEYQPKAKRHAHRRPKSWHDADNKAQKHAADQEQPDARIAQKRSCRLGQIEPFRKHVHSPILQKLQSQHAGDQQESRQTVHSAEQ